MPGLHPDWSSVSMISSLAVSEYSSHGHAAEMTRECLPDTAYWTFDTPGQPDLGMSSVTGWVRVFMSRVMVLPSVPYITATRRTNTNKRAAAKDMSRHGPGRIDVPLRPHDSVPYSAFFRGQNPVDQGRISQIGSLTTYAPLYEALKKRPSLVDGLPPDCFTWVCNNITYSSGNCTFDRNMWIANDLATHWNAMSNSARIKENDNERHVAPIIQSINYLLDGGGLAEDRSRPPDHLEKLLPELLQRPALSKLRRAAKAVAWKNMADSIENPDDEAAKHQAKARFLLLSAELGSNTAPFLKNGFSKSRQLEAGAALAEKWRAQSEATPQEQFSMKAHQFYTAVGAEIGMYVMHSAEVVKADMSRGAQLCLGDLREVHQAKEPQLKQALKRVSLQELFSAESQTPENESAPKEPSWMQTADLCCYKGAPIKLY